MCLSFVFLFVKNLAGQCHRTRPTTLGIDHHTLVNVQTRVVKPTEYIVNRIPDSDPEETECPLQRIHLSVIGTRLGWTTTQ